MNIVINAANSILSSTAGASNGSSRTSSASSASKGRDAAQTDEELFSSLLGQSDVDKNQQKLQEEQAKAAEDLKRKQEQIQQRQERENELSMLEQQLKASREEAKAMEDSFKTFSKCMTIASRIAKGDIVPVKDMKYLAEHEPDLYKQAILMRVPNNKPKKHKSVLEDEDEQTNETQDSTSPESGGTEAAAEVSEVSAAGEASSGGEAGAETGE